MCARCLSVQSWPLLASTYPSPIFPVWLRDEALFHVWYRERPWADRHRALFDLSNIEQMDSDCAPSSKLTQRE